MQVMYNLDGFNFFVKYDLKSQTAHFTERRAVEAGYFDLKSNNIIFINDDIPGLSEAQVKLLVEIKAAMNAR